MKSVPVPLHLETEDHFLFGLTVRQCLLLFVGAGLSYSLFLQVFDRIPNPMAALIIGLSLALLFFLGMVALAFAHVSGRGLEEWGLVILLYLSQPKVFIWHFNTPDAFDLLDLQRKRLSYEKQEQESGW